MAPSSQELHTKAIQAAIRLGRITPEQAQDLPLEKAIYKPPVYWLINSAGQQVAGITSGQMGVTEIKDRSAPVESKAVKQPTSVNSAPSFDPDQLDQQRSFGSANLNMVLIMRNVGLAVVCIASIFISFKANESAMILAKMQKLTENPKYSYRIDSPSDTSFDSFMETLGAEGWEVVSARRALDGGTASYEIISRKRLQGAASASVERIFNQPKNK